MSKKGVFICIPKFKKVAVAFLIVAVGLMCILTPTIVLSQSKTYTYSIVIDAGHGGIDGGSKGYSGTKEKDFNLQYALTLQRYCNNYGLKTYLTRTDDFGLYSPFSINKKKDDMLKRKDIIQKSKPNIVVSIHMNSFHSSSSRGAQVFYNTQNNNSKMLAESIQKQFVMSLTKPRKTPQTGDYYMLKCSDYPSVIVECGFISNPEEEALLLNKDYKEKLCYSILCGVVNYLMY